MKRLWQTFQGWVKARYEAASQKWGDRSWINSAIQDARFDADRAAQQEILRKARYFEANDAVVQRLTDLFEQFTVGPRGLLMVPDTSDQDWNISAAQAWEFWCQFPDLTSMQSCGMLQGLMARSWFIDGECFILLTSNKKKGTVSGEPLRARIQVIESHRVDTPPDKRDREGKDIIQGIRIDANGRPVSYFVRDAFDQKRFDEISADFVIHIFEPTRPGQMRGLSFLYAVMNELHDLSDLMLYEMAAAKEASSVMNIITTASGEIKSAADLRRMKMTVQSQDAGGNPVVKQDDQYYSVRLGGRTMALKKGEDIKQFGITRPSVVTIDYWESILARICAGTGISRLLVMPYSQQGTVTRADLDISAMFFRSRSEVIASAMRRVYLWVMRLEIDYGALDGAPDDWMKVIARPPRAPNVDVGRNSAAIIAELEAGIRTPQDIFAEMGMDWRDQTRKKAEYRFYVRQLAKEFSEIDPDIEISAEEIAASPAPVAPEADPMVQEQALPTKTTTSNPYAATA